MRPARRCFRVSEFKGNRMNSNSKEEKQPKPDNAPSRVGLMFDPMEQMRELLFGATKRETERQIGLLEAKVDEMRKDFLARFEALDSLLLELARDTEKNQADAILSIGGAITELGDKVKALSAKRKS
jgi:hypothetical protein